MVLDGLPGLYGLKYDSATACGLPLYLCSYKLDDSVIGSSFSIGLMPQWLSEESFLVMLGSFISND